MHLCYKTNICDIILTAKSHLSYYYYYFLGTYNKYQTLLLTPKGLLMHISQATYVFFNGAEFYCFTYRQLSSTLVEIL